MVLQKLMDNIEQSNGRCIYRDKDMLAMSLPPVVDLSLYTMLYNSVNNAARDNVRYLLLDFSEAEKLCDSGVAAFMSLQKLARDVHIRLLMLDTPIGMHNQLEYVVPEAFWIDMSRNNPENSFIKQVQDVIAKAH